MKKPLELSPAAEASFNRTFLEARTLINQYVSARDALTKLGILRTGRVLQGDYAEWLLANMYGLQLPKNPVQAGYDATDATGAKYQIKSRLVKDTRRPTSFDLSEVDSDFDILLCVFFSERLELLGILQIPRETVKELGSQVKERFCFRWNRETSEDPRVMRIFWKCGEPSLKA
jgi:hypothetical protein